jgi:hypothetical protein
LQEDSPEQVGKAIARFLADVRAGSLDPGRPG